MLTPSFFCSLCNQQISAKESRKRKQGYVDGLERRVKICTQENQVLHKKVDTLKKENTWVLNSVLVPTSIIFFFFLRQPHPQHTHTHTHTHARAHTFNLYCIFSLCFDKFLFPPQNKQKREKGVFMFPATLTEPRHTATACTISGLKSQRKNMYACKRNISGPVTNLLSVLCILMQMLKWKKKEQA